MFRRISWYRQTVNEDGEPEELIDEGSVNLEEALIILASLPKTVRGSRRELRGFIAENGSFLEFTREGADAIHVRYENPNAEVYRMGVLNYREAKEMLIDFFIGRKLRWLDKLEPY